MKNIKNDELYNKIKRNFILFGSFSIFAVMISLQFVTGLFNASQVDTFFNEILYSIAENGGLPPTDFIDEKDINIETYIKRGFNENNFSVIVHSDKEFELISENSRGEFDDIYENLAIDVLDLGADTGVIGGYHYVVDDYKGNTIISFGDFWQEELLGTQTTQNFVFSAVISMVLLLLLLLWFSDRIVQPITKNIEKQKTFISDAGHELKTPLAIISANAEMLEIETDNKEVYINNIKNQTVRMTNLIENLLLLSSAHENPTFNHQKENLSKLVLETAQTFEVMANNKNCKLIIDVKQDLLFVCDLRKMQEMFVIFIDNAIKYSMDNSNIYIELNRINNKTVFTIKNEIAKDSNIETEKLFDRFYRADASRTRQSGGYGLGLSIAKSIATLHNGTIKVNTLSSDASKNIIFSITFI